jgi:hypothetical protein
LIVCDFCRHYRPDGQCYLGLKIPKAMGCREFDPSLERFCSDPKDFVSPAQIVQMATFFGFKGGELKKVNLMAARAESARS